MILINIIILNIEKIKHKTIPKYNLNIIKDDVANNDFCISFNCLFD